MTGRFVPGFMTIARGLNLRHLTRRRLRTSLTVSGIAAGVALVFSISLINATLLSTFRASVRDIAGRAEIEVAATDQRGMSVDVVSQIARLEGVELVAPAVRATTMLTGPGADRQRTLVLGITPAFRALFPDDNPFAQLNVEGGFGTTGRGILLSRSVADPLGVELGDFVLADTPRGRTQVEVTGLVGGGAIGAVNGGALGVMLLPAAQDLFAKEGRIDSVYVAVDPAEPIAAVDDRIEQSVAPSVVVGPPGERARGFERIFGSIGTLISMAGTVALFVALFVVFNTMSMALAERRREISMALSFGATRGQLFAAFLGEAALLGTIAAALGLMAGYALANALVDRALDAYRFLPVGGAGDVRVDAVQVAVAGLGGIAVAVFGAFVPARRIFSVAPIESLRPEAAYEWSWRRTGRRSLALLVAGAILVLAAVALFATYAVSPDRRWIVTVAIVTGFAGISLVLPWIVPGVVAAARPVLARAFGTVGRLSADSLHKNPGRTTYTVAALVLTLGVALGVGSALRSYELEIDRLFNALAGAPIYVTSSSYSAITSDQPLSGELARDIEAVEGVRFVYPIRYALVTIGDQPALIYAIPVSRALESGATSVLTGFTDEPQAFVDGLRRGEIAVSQLTAETHDLAIGDRLTLPTPRGDRSFRVAAVFEDLLSFDSLYMDHAVYTRLFRDRTVDEFGVLVERGAEVDRVLGRVRTAVERTDAPALVLSKEQSLDRLLDIVGGTFALGRGVQLAALIVALLTIANTLFTAVHERRWEMGLQRAVGMSSRQLGRGVLLEAAAIGAIGGAGGSVLGMLNGIAMTRAMEAQFSWNIEFQVPVALMIVSLALGTAVAAAAGVLPSRVAVRTSIIEALRYE